MEVAVRTHVGMKRRINEDRTGLFTREGGRFMLAVVADGMGGHKSGDTASRMAVEGFGEEFIKADITKLNTGDGRAGWLADVTDRLNRGLFEHARSNEECRGMGTTIEAAVIAGKEVTLCHIGDSRTYKLGPEGFEQVTKDHSLVSLLVDSGEITEEEARIHPKRNFIMKALGTDDTVEPDIIPLGLPEGSALLICSDGLSNKLGENEIAETVAGKGTATERADALVNLANERGGEDNISVILIDNGVREADAG
ncbi:Stp1/IreP family PP2C-type Ser/Thr phosphatase [Bhargavaea massiliensis]|uniref:Stp1/IreP family PP2C-type Ser/Thr phosphatase n=1 Tax=Bhargavaea massiliensis TaxID=2697500 RepID=UPI001BCE1EDB